jgi:2-keto-3-deoxy-L-rhamnonate aldolase RhmA
MSNDIFPNKFKAALAAHQIQIGCWSALASPISTEVLGLAVLTGWCWTANMRRTISAPLSRS